MGLVGFGLVFGLVEGLGFGLAVFGDAVLFHDFGKTNSGGSGVPFPQHDLVYFLYHIEVALKHLPISHNLPR